MILLKLILGSLLINWSFGYSTSTNQCINQVIREQAWFAALSFCPDNLLVDWSCKACRKVPGGKFLTSFESADYGTRGVLVRNDQNKQLIVSFRGSENVKNDKNNIRVKLRPFSEENLAMGKVHTGFMESMLSLSNMFITDLAKALKTYSDYSIIVTGHSLGGAMASLAVEIIRSKFKVPSNKILLITYGQPLTGDFAFADWHNLQRYLTFRVVNEKDSIPHIPELEKMAYKHFNQEVWAINSKQLKICHAVNYEDHNCSNSIPSLERTAADHNYFFDTTFGEGAC